MSEAPEEESRLSWSRVSRDEVRSKRERSWGGPEQVQL